MRDERWERVKWVKVEEMRGGKGCRITYFSIGTCWISKVYVHKLNVTIQTFGLVVT